MASRGSRIAYDNREAVVRRLRMRVQTVNARFAMQGAEKARELAPKRTGFLASTVEGKVEGDGWYIRAWASYTPFVLFGTRYTTANPFLFTARRLMMRDYYETISRVLNSM